MTRKVSPRSLYEIVGGVSGVSVILGGWLYVDSYFAKAADLSDIATALEQSQIQLRLDIIEERVDRELEKPEPNERRIEKFNNQLRRLEKRYEFLLGQ